MLSCLCSLRYYRIEIFLERFLGCVNAPLMFSQTISEREREFFIAFKCFSAICEIFLILEFGCPVNTISRIVLNEEMYGFLIVVNMFRTQSANCWCVCIKNMQNNIFLRCIQSCFFKHKRDEYFFVSWITFLWKIRGLNNLEKVFFLWFPENL